MFSKILKKCFSISLKFIQSSGLANIINFHIGMNQLRIVCGQLNVISGNWCNLIFITSNIRYTFLSNKSKAWMPSPSSEKIISPYRVFCYTCRDTDLKVSTLYINKEKVSVYLVLSFFHFFFFLEVRVFIICKIFILRYYTLELIFTKRRMIHKCVIFIWLFRMFVVKWKCRY